MFIYHVAYVVHLQYRPFIRVWCSYNRAYWLTFPENVQNEVPMFCLRFSHWNLDGNTCRVASLFDSFIVMVDEKCWLLQQNELFKVCFSEYKLPSLVMIDWSVVHNSAPFTYKLTCHRNFAKNGGHDFGHFEVNYQNGKPGLDSNNPGYKNLLG